MTNEPDRPTGIKSDARDLKEGIYLKLIFRYEPE
jgi:hypothetical protein